VITKDLIIAKDFCTYSIKIIRQEKCFVITDLNARSRVTQEICGAGSISATPARQPAANTN
jgi:hypothetical protein